MPRPPASLCHGFRRYCAAPFMFILQLMVPANPPIRWGTCQGRDARGRMWHAGHGTARHGTARHGMQGRASHARAHTACRRWCCFEPPHASSSSRARQPAQQAGPAATPTPGLPPPAHLPPARSLTMVWTAPLNPMVESLDTLCAAWPEDPQGTVRSFFTNLCE